MKNYDDFVASLLKNGCFDEISKTANDTITNIKGKKNIPLTESDRLELSIAATLEIVRQYHEWMNE